MNEENLWNAFVLSGSVTDYLNYEESPAKQIADEYWNLNITQVDEIVEKCKKERVDGVLNFCIEILDQVLEKDKLKQELLDCICKNIVDVYFLRRIDTYDTIRNKQNVIKENVR